MTDTTIENILFHAPRPIAPPELLQQLRAGIVLPAAKPRVQTREWQNPRRWFPALAFGLVMLSCAILFAVQSSWSTNLKRQNEALQATVADLPHLREQHVALDAAQARQEELVQLKKDNDEMHSLQTEVTRLRDLAVQIQRLQNENQRLTADLSAPASKSGGNFFDDATQQMGEAKYRAERIQCVNNLKQLGLAMRIWAGDNADKYPNSLVVMSNELSTVKILICPGDEARKSYSTLTFGQFQDNMTSYQYIAQPDDERFPECITAYCPIHHNYLLGDGSVQMVDPTKVGEAKRDGRLYLQRINSGSEQ